MIVSVTKVQMVENLSKSSSVKVPPKRVKLLAKDMRALPNVDLDYFVNCHNQDIFYNIGIRHWIPQCTPLYLERQVHGGTGDGANDADQEVKSYQKSE